MKRIAKMLGSIMLLFAMIMLLQIPMDAKAYSGFEQTGCTSTTVSVKWDKYEPGTGRTFSRYEIGNSAGTFKDCTIYDQNTTSMTIKGYEAGETETIYLYCYYTYSDGSEGHMSYSARVNTLPEKVTSASVSYANSSNKSISIKVGTPATATGVKIYLYSASTGKYIKSKLAYSYATITGIKNNYAYKYRIRAYYKNGDNGKTYYGPYSKYHYFDNLTAKTITGGSYRNSFGLKLYKGTGIKYYTLYMSKSSSSGFKKTATLKVTGKSKTFKITKYGSSKLKGGNTYYCKVVPMIKVGSKVKSGEIYGQSSLYIWK